MARPAKSAVAIDSATLEQIEASSDGLVDLETAAMLMTDLHHKATAAMSKQNSDPDFSSSGTAILDPSMTSLPQLPWDAFMPRSVTEPKAHSISSSVSGSQDSRASLRSFTTVGSLQPRLDQQAADEAVPRPVREAAPGAARTSATPTPAPCSPLPGVACPRSPAELPQSPGSTSQEQPYRVPRVEGEDDRGKIVDGIRQEDSENALMDNFRLPGLGGLNRYLSTYFCLFHHHLPFLHPASLKPSDLSPPLLLAVLSIGALYSFEQEQAYMLHVGSKVLVSQFLQNKENFSSRKCPLWTMQSTLLNMIFASWSGDPKGLEWACSIKSLLANVSVSDHDASVQLR